MNKNNLNWVIIKSIRVDINDKTHKKICFGMRKIRGLITYKTLVFNNDLICNRFQKVFLNIIGRGKKHAK